MASLAVLVKRAINLFILIIFRIYLTLRRRPPRFKYSAHPTATLTESGIISADWEWDLDTPQRDKREDVFLYGINSDGGAIILQIYSDPFGNEAQYRFTYRSTNGQCYIMRERSRGSPRGHTDSKGRLLEYKLPGLSLEFIAPFRNLRLKVRGYMKNPETNELVFARMRFIWCPTSNVFDFRSDFDAWQLAKSMKRGMISYTSELPQIENRYEQYGQLKGEVTILGADDRVVEEGEQFFWGHRAKTIHESSKTAHSDSSNPIELIETTRICGYDELGFGFSITKVNDARRGSYAFGHAFTGFLLMPLLDLNLESAPANIDPQLVASHGMKIQLFIDRLIKAHIKDKGVFVDSKGICDMDLNGHKGQCIVWKEEILQSEAQVLPSRSKVSSSNQTHSVDANRNTVKLNGVVDKPSSIGRLVVSLDDEEAESEELCGGKGSSLATLTHLSKKEESSGITPSFQVPKGLVITTNSFKLFLNHNPTIHEAIENLQAKVWAEGPATGDALSKVCDQTANLIAIASIPSNVKLLLREKLDELFGAERDQKLFAIRSSACGEDSEEMSAAGQMTTFLGVKGLNSICEAILKCWSSQFSPIAVEYKRSYGQLITAPMAVVVQEMVDCETAGVLFTCDPYSGDERLMIITANYGLGESVVSASSEPDTIKVKIQLENNSYDHERSVAGIESIEIGKKQHMIKLGKEQETEQIDLEEDSDKRNKCCLHASEITNLAKMALRILAHYGTGPRDIEWGIKNEQLYCFQCRPVTGLDQWTEYELTHECDRGMPSEHEVISKANVGEVMGEACSPLGRITSLWGIMDKQMYNRRYIFLGRDRPYVPFCSGIACIAGHTFLNLSGGGGKKQSQGTPMSKAIQIAVFGHEVEDENLKRVVEERTSGSEPARLEKLRQTLAMIWLFSKTRKDLLKAKNDPRILKMKQELLENRNFANSRQFFNHILDQIPTMYIPMDIHLLVTYSSAISNMLIIGVLSSAQDKSHIWADFAKMVANAREVVSADVPEALKKLAMSIDNPGEFVKMSDEEALQYLRESKTQAGRNFKDFLEQHGHRCFMEFDIQRERWAENPLSLVKSIKNMIPLVHPSTKEGAANGHLNLQQKSMDDVLAEVTTPLTNTKKWLLKKLFIPITQGKVGLREEAKAFWIYCVYLYRQAWLDLAKWMTHKEGYLPDPNLLPFLTIEEVKRLLETRDPLLVIKAKKRQKLWPKLNSYRYPEMNHGPKLIPLNRSIPQHLNRDGNAVKITGTPVFGGRVEGRACVAVYLDEAAKQLKPGDILITYSTDIAWSPYFPALSGIATEIGGLMSHGAVIAREYGLPCIIGATGGTAMVRTGDWVELDSTKGQLTVIKPAES